MTSKTHYLKVVEAVQRQVEEFDKQNVPVLSNNKIESITALVLRHLDPDALRHPYATQVMSIAEYLQGHHGLQIAVQELGLKDGHQVLGKIVFSQNIIFLDPVLARNHPAFRFTVAHELGHWFLHRWKPIQSDTSKIEESSDTEHTLNRRLGSLAGESTPRRRIEWQANRFAAGLTMPKNTFQVALAAAQRDLGIRRWVGFVFLNEDDEQSQVDLARIINRLSRQYGVSMRSIRVRLDNLGLLKSADSWDEQRPGEKT